MFELDGRNWQEKRLRNWQLMNTISLNTLPQISFFESSVLLQTD